MTEPTELLPCPFCGSKATASVNKGESLWSHDVVDWTRVHCTNDDCNAQTEATCEGYEPSAIEVWNTRTPQPTQAQAGAGWKVVHQFRREHCSDWYDGHADHGDGGGPYEERTLYTAGAVPLTLEQIDEIHLANSDAYERGDVEYESHGFARAVEAHHGIKGGQHGTE